ncbi:MAG: DUF1501 domain-containing protein [Mariniblastus sp.]
MKKCNTHHRRNFLKTSSMIALAPTIPSFLANYARANSAVSDERVLVVIQMGGGNDGVNTVVPFADEGYKKHRKELFIPKSRLLRLNDSVGLNPAMRAAASLWEDDQLAIVPSVGYPNPNRSHDASMAIWQTCQFKESNRNSHGWLGLALDQTKLDAKGAPSSLMVGDRERPITLQGRKSVCSSIQNLDGYTISDELKESTAILDSAAKGHESGLAEFLTRSQMDAYAMSDSIQDIAGKVDQTARYPNSKLGGNLKTIASLMKAGFGTRVFYAIQGGYDTHATQNRTHAGMLSSLSRSVKAFLDDLKSAKLDDRVVVLCFSEFGRRVDENGSRGTDHGSAGLTMLAGPNVKSGIHGGYSSLLDLDDGGLRMKTDFRSIYASLLQDWLGVGHLPVLGKEITKLDLIKAG